MTKWITPLLVVACIYVLAQLLLVSHDRFLNYDEAVYYSQVADGTVPVSFSASRSRGLTWLIAPIAATGFSLHTLRIVLIFLSGLGLWGAFRVWQPSLGPEGAAAGAGVLGCSWISIYYGSEVSPNLAVGLLLLLGMGLLLHGGKIRYALGGLLCLTFAACIRPSDVTAAVGAMLAAALLFQRRSLLRTAGLSVLGVALGWLPWVLEALEKFGSVEKRWGKAKVLARAHDPYETFMWYLSMNDGPLHEKQPTSDASVEGMLWWFALACLTLGGAWLGLRQRERRPALVVLAPAVALLGAYLLTAAARPRYLLPVYALLAPAAGLGLCFLLAAARRAHRGLAVALLLLLVVPAGAWHVSTLRKIDAAQYAKRNDDLKRADALRKAAAGRPCAVATAWSLAPIAVGAGCTGFSYYGNKKWNYRLRWFIQGRACAGDQVFGLGRKDTFKTTPAAKWKKKRITKSGYIFYAPNRPEDLCRHLGGTPVPQPPAG